MNDEVIGLSMQLDGSQPNQTVKGFKQELREAQEDVVKLSAKFGMTSKEAQAAARRVAEMRDNIGDARSLVEAFNPDRKFAAFSSSLQATVGGFTALTGAMGLFGADSQEAEKAILKVQSALALSEGINNILEAKDTFKQFGAVIKSTTIFQKANAVATTLATGATRALGIAATTTGVAFKALRTAIISTGIGALVVAVGYAIGKILEFTESTKDAAESQRELAESMNEASQAAMDAGLNFLRQEEQLALARARNAGKSEAELLRIQQEYADKRIKQRSQYLDKVKNRGAAEDAINEDLTQKEIRRLDFETDQRKKGEQAAEQAAEKRRQRAEKEKQEREQRLKEQKAEQDAEFEFELRRQKLATDLRDEKREEDVERRKEQLEQEKEHQENLFNLLKEYTVKPLQDEGFLELQHQLAVNNLSKKDQDLLAIDLEYQEKFRIAEGHEEEMIALKIEKNERKRAVDQQYFEMSLSMASSALGALSGLFSQDTAAFKILATSQALINTYLGASQVLRDGTLPTFAKIAGVISVIATGIKTVREINKVQVPGAGGGGSTAFSSSLSATSAPLLAGPQSVNTNINQDQVNQIANATVRAFVVEKDVTSSQERARILNRAARIG